MRILLSASTARYCSIDVSETRLSQFAVVYFIIISHASDDIFLSALSGRLSRTGSISSNNGPVLCLNHLNHLSHVRIFNLDFKEINDVDGKFKYLSRNFKYLTPGD